MYPAKHHIFLASFAIVLAATVSFPVNQLNSARSSADTNPGDHSTQSAGPAPTDLTGRAQELFGQAADLLARNQLSKALLLLREAAAIAPNEPAIHHYLGYALWKENRFKEAAHELEAALRLDPKNVYTLYFLGRVSDSQGDTEGAIRRYEAEVSLGNTVYDSDQRLGEAYLRKGNSQKALVVIKKALQATPWESALHYQLARIYQKIGQPTEAREEFDATNRLKQSDQASIEQLLEMSAALRDSRADRVFSIREALLAKSPKDPEVMYSLGYLLGKGGFYADAEEPLQQAARMLPDSYEAEYNLGLTLLKLVRADEAETALKRAVELRPESFESNSTLAVLYVNQGRHREAIERLRIASRTRPNDEKILALLGDQYVQAQDPERAIPVLRKAIELKPSVSEPRHLLVEAYQEKKAYADALGAAQEGAKLFPEDGRFEFEIGNQLSNLGRYQDALPYAEKSVQLNPSLAEGYDLLGDLELRRGEYELALANFKRAKNIDPDNLEALRAIGQALIRLKRYDEAVAELTRAIPIHPDEAEFYYDLSQAYVRLGEREKAAEAAAKFNQLHSAELARQDSVDTQRSLPKRSPTLKQ